ncbi:serine/threonine-protein kinase (plasmid) [Tundrisphaera lichenicola]|uniref:serine/threonine-protein kinase n=1 Tax=Tundrisphaera lichenicola TaxID=2029860 RepID=UPI003EBF5986
MPAAPKGYRVLRFLGAGAFGEAWLAEDLSLRREVVLKTIEARLDPGRREGALASLRRDAQLLATLRHPNVVAVHAWLSHGDADFLVVEYVPGGSLADRMRASGEPFPWHGAARYIADVAEGLSHVHDKGVIHRDVKPANILWEPHRDEALLADFGIAARLAEDPDVSGTLSYLAPEVFDGVVSPAQDVYALAATLFCLVTGEPPFVAKSAAKLRRAAERGLPDPDPRLNALPARLGRVIREGLRSDPAQRSSLPELLASLRGALNHLLADTLTIPQQQQGLVNLRLLVSRHDDRHAFTPVVATHPPPDRQVRDMKRVPPPPASVTLRTGDRVRIEVVADRPGYATVYNIGPSGNLNLLYPSNLHPGASRTPLQVDRPLQILDVQLAPPTGIERLFAFWTREQLPLRLDEVHALVESGIAPTSASYRGTRDMVRIQEAVRQMSREDWRVAVLEIEHLAG